MEHDVLCEMDNTTRAYNKPPLGMCWCADRADGYVFWTFVSGAATTELSQVPDDAVPPNELGGAA